MYPRPETERGQSGRQPRSDFWEQNGTTLSILGLVTLFVLVCLSPSSLRFVASGHEAVRWRRFGGGTDTSVMYDEGFHVIPPWDRFYDYNMRVQQANSAFTAISKDGLRIEVSVSVRYRPKREFLGLLHKEVGSNYLEVVILPEVEALLREVFGHFSPEELYTTKNYLAQQLVTKGMGKIGERYIALDDLLIRNIKLPDALEAAIESKLSEEQRSLAMEYRISQTEQEARRKIIEAIGVDESQKLISESLTTRLLQYKSIEAAADLAKAGNSKLVIFGGGKDVPIILNSGFNAGLGADGLDTNTLPVSLSNLNSNGWLQAVLDKRGGALATNLLDEARRRALPGTNTVVSPETPPAEETPAKQ